MGGSAKWEEEKKEGKVVFHIEEFLREGCV